MPWMLDFLSLVMMTKGQFRSAATLKKILTVISCHFDMPDTQLVIRWQITEHNRGKLDAKEKVAVSFKYLFVYPFGVKIIFIWVSDPQIFIHPANLDNKYGELSFELNSSYKKHLKGIEPY